MPEKFDLLTKLSHEQVLSLVEELDDEVRTQKEYYETRILCELVQDLEDQMMLRDIRIYVQKKPEAKGFEPKF